MVICLYTVTRTCLLEQDVLYISWQILTTNDHLPSKHESLAQCWINVDSLSKTMDQHWSNIGPTSRVRWVCPWQWWPSGRYFHVPGINIYKFTIPSKHETFTQCLCNVAPSPAVQHWTNHECLLGNTIPWYVISLHGAWSVWKFHTAHWIISSIVDLDMNLWSIEKRPSRNTNISSSDLLISRF